MSDPYCTEWTPSSYAQADPGVPLVKHWHGYTYRDAENRDAHARLFQTGATYKLSWDTGGWRLWPGGRIRGRRQFHLIVGVPW